MTSGDFVDICGDLTGSNVNDHKVLLLSMIDFVRTVEDATEGLTKELHFLEASDDACV